MLFHVIMSRFYKIYLARHPLHLLPKNSVPLGLFLRVDETFLWSTL